MSTAPIGRIALVLFASLWITAYAMYQRPPTVAAHVVMLLCVGIIAVVYELRTRRRKP